MLKRCLSPIIFIILMLSVFFPIESEAIQGKVKVVASFSIIQDLAQIIGKQYVEVQSLVPRGTEVHSYSFTGKDIHLVNQSHVFFVNGLNFESWILKSVKALKVKPTVISDGIVERKITYGKFQVVDPHAWLNPENLIVYSKNISEELGRITPEHANEFKNNHLKFSQEINSLIKDAKLKFLKIPSDSKKILTNHDAFGYFGDYFNFKFISVSGLDNQENLSGRDIKKIIETVKSEKVKIIFLENMSNSQVLQQIQKDTQVQFGGELFADTLTDEKGKAPTIFRFFSHNLNSILKAYGLENAK